MRWTAVRSSGRRHLSHLHCLLALHAREKYLHCIACNLGKGGAVGAEELALVLFAEREMETMLLPFSAMAHWWLSENNQLQLAVAGRLQLPVCRGRGRRSSLHKKFSSSSRQGEGNGGEAGKMGWRR